MSLCTRLHEQTDARSLVGYGLNVIVKAHSLG